MNKERVLLTLVLADVALALSVIVSEAAFQWTLPAALSGYSFGALSSPWSLSSLGSLGNLLLWAAWSMVVGCTVAAWIGLLNYWRFSRELYLMAWGFWLVLILLSGPSVMTPVGAMVNTLESVVGGAIMSLVYFSDLSRRFVRDSLPAPLPIRA
jgi:hypothetical protein